MDMEYDEKIMLELTQWKAKMNRSPSLVSDMGAKLQTRINKVIPEKIHKAITNAIREMTKTVLLGAEFTSAEAVITSSLEEREIKVLKTIKFFRNAAAAEGAITGAGGILLGLADFPIWLTLKMKMLFEIASLYGKQTGNLKERIFLLYIFQLSFSSKRKQKVIYEILSDWNHYSRQLPDHINDFDWRTFQQDYRDYIDIAKLLQLVPGIGAAVGAVVNHRLTNKLGVTAMNAYRLREVKRLKGV